MLVKVPGADGIRIKAQALDESGEVRSQLVGLLIMNDQGEVYQYSAEGVSFDLIKPAKRVKAMIYTLRNLIAEEPEWIVGTLLTYKISEGTVFCCDVLKDDHKVVSCLVQGMVEEK